MPAASQIQVPSARFTPVPPRASRVAVARVGRVTRGRAPVQSPDMPRSGRWLTAANGLTLLRLIAAPLLALAIAAGAVEAAALLFALAVATDFADGYVARRLQKTSARGRLRSARRR